MKRGFKGRANKRVEFLNELEDNSDMIDDILGDLKDPKKLFGFKEPDRLSNKNNGKKCELCGKEAKKEFSVWGFKRGDKNFKLFFCSGDCKIKKTNEILEDILERRLKDFKEGKLFSYEVLNEIKSLYLSIYEFEELKKKIKRDLFFKTDTY